MRRLSVSLLLWTGCSGDVARSDDTGSPPVDDTATGLADTDIDAVVDGPIGDCAARAVTFGETTADEVVQWNIEGIEREALPGTPGAYFFNGYLNVVTYASDFSGSISFGLTGNQTEVAAGTYTCSAGEAMAQVSGVGVVASPVFESECSLRFDAGFGDGGRIEGTMWALFAPNTALGFSGGCVHARFAVTDAAD